VEYDAVLIGIQLTVFQRIYLQTFQDPSTVVELFAPGNGGSKLLRMSVTHHRRPNRLKHYCENLKYLSLRLFSILP